jgi:hypothetical protein
MRFSTTSVMTSREAREVFDIAFIVGVARSGTSILGELVGAHPDVKYIFEAYVPWRLAGRGIDGSDRFTAEQATPGVRRFIRWWFRWRKGNARIVVEKNPRNILRVPFLRAVFPEAKFIHIVRDGRDVTCSLLPGIGGRFWAHVRPPQWREIFSRYRGVIRCAHAWNETIRIGLNDLADVPHLRIRYEDLVASPREIAGQIFEYLGLPLHPNVIEFCRNIQNSTEGTYQAKYQTVWSRRDHRRRVGRWRENLTAEQQHDITRILAPTLESLGYPL